MPEDYRKKIHVPLSADVHADLFAHSEKLGAPATAIAREAIEEWLERRRQKELAKQIRAYAKKTAGTPRDLDTALEAAGVEKLARVQE